MGTSLTLPLSALPVPVYRGSALLVDICKTTTSLFSDWQSVTAATRAIFRGDSLKRGRVINLFQDKGSLVMETPAVKTPVKKRLSTSAAAAARLIALVECTSVAESYLGVPLHLEERRPARARGWPVPGARPSGRHPLSHVPAYKGRLKVCMWRDWTA